MIFLQITGAVDSVRKALQSVSQQLLENPPRDRDAFPANVPSGPSSHPFASIPRPEGLPPTSYHRPIQGTPFSGRPYDIADYHSSIAPPFSKFHGGAVVAGQPPISPELLTYRLMCSNDKVGSVIGKGGSIIKTLQHETGCEIKILGTEPESDDRIIVILGPAVMLLSLLLFSIMFFLWIFCCLHVYLLCHGQSPGRELGMESFKEVQLLC